MEEKSGLKSRRTIPSTSSEASSTSSSEINNNNVSLEKQVLKRNHFKNYESYHKVRDSLLSSASGYTNYRGILNLCVVLLVMSSGRLVLENILKYGFLVRFDIPILFIKDPTAWPSLLAIVLSNMFIVAALKLEKKLEKGEYTERKGVLLCSANILTALMLPAIYLWYRETNPVASFLALAIYTILIMKLVSYYQVNKYYRMKRIEPRDEHDGMSLVSSHSVNRSLSELDNNNNSNNARKEKSNCNGYCNGNHTFITPIINYPENLTYSNLYYFAVAPTLCYEINFPRSDRIRKSFLIRRCTEMVFLGILQFVLIQQWIVPILANSQTPFRETNILKIVERLLKLAVPNHIIWLMGFYCFFHSYLNVVAEILRFGDREFYKDWWNSETVDKFWSTWNVPVHAFCLRHIYKPLLAQGITRFQAALIVFFLSAFFHEYLVSIPLRMFRIWSFSGMLLQIPFAIIVRQFCHGNYGNMAVWVSLIIGQPIAIMMYIHDYYIDYFRPVV